MLLVALLALAAAPGLALAHDVEAGCAPRLLDDRKHPFIEAQAACDAYASFVLVDEVLAGEARAPRVAALHALVDDILSPRARRPFRDTGERALGAGAGDARSVPRSVLYRGYLLAMLAGLARVDGLTPPRAQLFDALAGSLVEDLAASKSGWLESFRGGTWPCDHALAASGLVLHGALRAGHRGAPHDDGGSAAAGRALAARIDALRAGPHGFPARVDARGRVVEATQRGTVLAWTAGFLGLAGLPEAGRFAQTLVDDMCGDPSPVGLSLGMAACREWPRGVKRKADAVSGPIVGGWGSGASALAIAATRITGRTAWADALSATSSTMLGALHKRTGPLERAILAWGAGARSWLP